MAVTNPTQLFAKEDIVAGWNVDVCCLCETSHTVRAAPLIKRSFAKLGYKAVLGREVQDKFKVKDSVGSLRGLSKGVAVVSSLPAYGYEGTAVSEAVWQSSRLLHAVVQSGKLVMHFVVVYLAPGAYIGNAKYDSNARLMASAVALVEPLRGPTVLCGDWNTKSTDFEVLDQLTAHLGFEDLALTYSRRTGCPPEPTCMNATRHTFMFGNQEIIGMLQKVQVSFHNDLDKHSVLCVDLAVPSENPYVWKWPMPRRLTDAVPDIGSLGRIANDRAESLKAELDGLLEAGELDEALQRWARHLEMNVLESSGVPSSKWRSFQGRCASYKPVRIKVGPARLRAGRSGDFRPGLYQSSLKIRQWTKQVRRLQSLERLMRAAQTDGTRVTGRSLEQLWRAIVGASGFPGGFRSFLISQVFFVPDGFPPEGWVREVRTWLQEQVQGMVRKAAADGRRLFVGALEESWTKSGGALPCRLIRDHQVPRLEELRLKRVLQLAPQRWMPDGLAWVKYRDVSFLKVGDKLSGEIEVEIRDIVDNKVQLSSRVTRRQAAHMIWTKVSTEPEEWCREVLDGWNKYWRRDADEEVPEAARRYLETIQPREAMEFYPIQVKEWSEALKRTKTHTMVGVDGFCVSDLQLVPVATLEALMMVFNEIERRATWPQLCKKWLVVLLRKEQAGLLSWDMVRPISVAGLLYRTWAKARTMVMMRHACSIASATVSPVLSTRSIWGLELELLDSCVRRGQAACGFVLDITKAFNVLNRGLLKAVMLRYGFSRVIVEAWFAALMDMERQVLVQGSVYGSSVATTGVPEGDPLSVVAMFSIAACFRDFVATVGPEVLVLTFADNWEVFAWKDTDLKAVMQVLPPFMDGMMLPVNPAKCWLWSISPSVRRTLRSWTWIEEKAPVLLSARVLGADVSYSFRRSARVRNGRIKAGHRRMARISGLPLGRQKKVMLLFKSAYPQSLHAAEASALPRSAAKRLRSKAVKAVGLSASGVSPWLAASVGTHAIFDPEWSS